jgi:hypothetical protein
MTCSPPWEVSDGLGVGGATLAEEASSLPVSGRNLFDDCLALQRILFVLHTGIGWVHLPHEVGLAAG